MYQKLTLENYRISDEVIEAGWEDIGVKESYREIIHHDNL